MTGECYTYCNIVMDNLCKHHKNIFYKSLIMGGIMKKHFTLLFFLAATISLYFGFGFGDKSTQSPVFVNQEMQGTSNPNLVTEFTKRWYEPYDMITPDMRQQMVDEIGKLPTDK